MSTPCTPVSSKLDVRARAGDDVGACLRYSTQSPHGVREVIVRRFEPADAPNVCEIFYRSVHEVASARYDRAQVDAWAPNVPDHTRWLQRLCEYSTFVADDAAGKTVGWISMSAAGHLDMIFCVPEATRCGIASKLHVAVENEAVSLGLERLTAHASLLAQPFFKRCGWQIDEHETIVRNGVTIPRAKMSKRLPS